MARTAGSNPSTYGDSLTFTATVTATAGNPSSVGTVTFKDGATSICAAVALSGNTAACSTSSLDAGTHSFTAEYSGTTSGTPQFSASTSSALSHTVDKKQLTVTAADKSKMYGDGDPAFTFSYAGFVLGNTAAVIDTAPTCTVSVAHVNAGSYPIACSGGVDNNYSFSYVNGTLTVDKAQLTVTADNKSKTYGAADPAFTFSYDGFVLGDTGAAIDTAPTCTVSVAHANAGSYPIVCSGGVDNNYSFSYVNGTLTVDPKAVTVTADDKTKTYGSADPAFTFSVTGLESGDSLAGVTCGVAAAHDNAGSYPIACSGNTNGNYSATYAPGTLTVDPKAVTVTAHDQTKTYGPPIRRSPSASPGWSRGTASPGSPAASPRPTRTRARTPLLAPGTRTGTTQRRTRRAP